MISFKDLREQMSDEMIKDILAQYNVSPVTENENVIIFPTCCHNLEGGSPKLYYYKNSHLFHCYTECSETFDIFTLLQKMHALRGQEISLKQAVKICSLDTTDLNENENIDFSNFDDIKYLQTINNAVVGSGEEEFKEYDKGILRRYGFDYIGLMPWIKEGISIEALQKFNIKYDEKRDAIIIPNFDYSGRLIGIRERFLREEDIIKGKYRPLYEDGVLYNHPTGRTFYGIFENHKIIEKKKMVIIYEGEKSVLKQFSIYGNENSIALATLGQNITRNHINLLLKMRVRDVILAYDTDYEDTNELYEVYEKYIEKGRLLAPYFNVSILMDFDFLLPYKSSPIDGGKEIFEKILKERRMVR